MQYLAHRDAEDGREQSILEHLTGTAKLAGEFGAIFSSAEQARRCAMLHDIGKYSDAFQKRIRGAKIRTDHSTAGAVEAAAMGDIAAAFAVAGHHGGIPDMGSRTSNEDNSTLHSRVRRSGGAKLEDYSAYKREVKIPQASIPQRLISCKEDAFFYTHMLFSCLVDADYLDTERFMRNGEVERGTGEGMETLLKKLTLYIGKWKNPKGELNIRRSQILEELLSAGERERGLYTLTVPTGGGKTISSMGFALRHALHTGQRRIIYIIPYTSIIEQTQSVFEEIFGAENVVAHYANADYSTDENSNINQRDRRRYLASENWDAPIILTTAVQFFESIFGNRPSRCRKLHNIADSILIFDEAQMLPTNYLQPCVWSITELVKNYGCTAVLCTATQPSLERLIREFYVPETLELCPNAAAQYESFRRVTYQYDGLMTDEALSAQLSELRQVLCIVNTRRQAQKIYGMLPRDGSFHLSTTMTPAHRRQVLDEIRKRLKEGLPCRVVSTSLIEAGVDVDFPTVYRAISGLDSILQAGGRCNREGRNDVIDSIVHIFVPECKPPRGMEQNIAAARRVIDRGGDIASPEAIEQYFHFLLYTVKGDEALDEKRIMKLMSEMAFCTVAESFHLIEDSGMTVYIPLEEGAQLTDELRTFGPSRALLRKLGKYAVSVSPHQYRALDEAGAVEQISENTAILLDESLYDVNTGLTLSAEGGAAKII